ncbi:pseudaminic acid synthase [Magnetovirga frankeli]|uniref:pseudaminic acid synthase n=1 Tax=Magnetovirga frankeli TaxID=947516 RepID=UPI001293EFA3|nr:pseudaminic acid synthase [gamma proteobacterium SS-5]
MTRPIQLLGKSCGPGHAPLLVAELSGNHNGRLETALKLIEAAAKAGADAIKIQSYTPDSITLDHDGPGFHLEQGLWQGRSLYELYQQAHTPWDWHPRLFQHAHQLGVPLFSSPFDASAVEMLQRLGCPAYKIASFELVDLGLIAQVAATGKPVILSTGMASLGEIEEAIAAFNGVAGHGDLLLLHCTSGYPTPVDEAHLNSIPVLRQCFDLPVGLSDHSQSSAVATAAVALGACLIEKHFMLSRQAGGVDAEFSLEPDEFRQLAQGCREAWRALGRASFQPTPAETSHIANRRSLYAVQDIPAGAPLTADNVRSIRPGFGLHPRELSQILGKRARQAIARGTALRWDLLD